MRAAGKTNRTPGRLLLLGLVSIVLQCVPAKAVEDAEEKDPPRLRVQVPTIVLRNVPINEFSIEVLDKAGKEVDTSFNGTVSVKGLRIVEAGEETRPTTLTAAEGVISRATELAKGRRVYLDDNFQVTLGEEKSTGLAHFTSGFWSLLPPLVAIGLAIWLKDVYIALFAAVYSGCLVLAGWNPALAFTNMMSTEKLGISKVLSDGWNLQVIVFTLFLGAMVKIMSDSGGTNAVVAKLSRLTSTRERGQLLTWFMGLLIFFDDYANTMLVGNAMRPVTDRLKVSREKLAFLIDSTAAPIAGLAIVSTWVGVELGAIREGLAELGVAKELTQQVFISSIPYRFYPIFLIGFVMMIAATGRDYGPMLKAERDCLDGKSKSSGKQSENAKQTSMWYAIVPVAVLIGWIAVGFALYYGDDFDSVPLLLQASCFAALTAAFMAVAGRAMSLRDAAESWMKGMTEMFPALVVLVLAWSVSSLCRTDGVNTAGYIIEQVGDSVSLELMPTLAFVVSGAIAFAVGSSYATMGLLIPLFISLVGSLLASQGADNMAEAVMTSLMLSTVGAILAGSIFGDHCSPISDTTVLSSAGAECNHLRHVATQMAYALTVGTIAIVCGYLPVGYGMNPWLMLLLGFAACFLVVRFVGRRAAAD